MTNSRHLCVFDECFDVASLSHFQKVDTHHQIDLFPLTGSIKVLHAVEDRLRSFGLDSVKTINSAHIIDRHVDLLRERVHKWASDFGEARIWNKTLKARFLLPGCDVSTWWFSFFSEKNTLKTKAFLMIAQVRALREILIRDRYDQIVVSVKDKSLRDSLMNVARRLDTPFSELAQTSTRGTRNRIKNYFVRAGLAGDLTFAFLYIVRILRRKYIILRYFPSISKRFMAADSLLFISYFPYLEKESAAKGIFRNKYALALQDKLGAAGVPITWVFMYDPIENISFEDAIKLSKKFMQNEETIFFLDEFLSFWDLFIGVTLFLRQVVLSTILYPFVKDNWQMEPIGEECSPIISSLWKTSFCGVPGIQGIIYSLTFKGLFKKMKSIKDCLYYSEMHAWEHSLNAAKSQSSMEVRSIGYQHSSIPRNWFCYFNDLSETRRTGAVTDLPLPNVLACNGELMCEQLSESNYPGITRVEALRYLYLDTILSTNISTRSKKSVLLVAGSIDRHETTLLASLVNQSYPSKGTVEVWFKGHPSMPFKQIFDELEIDPIELGYVICQGDISRHLAQARSVLVPSSTVAIEALAFGCEVIVPVFPDTMLISPLVGFDQYYHKVSNSDELIMLVDKIMGGYSLKSIEEYRRFVRRYWDTDPTLQKWSKLLIGDSN